jgi:hypothetical protein
MWIYEKVARMQTKPSSGSKTAPPERPGNLASENKVVTTIQIDRDTLDTLFDVALARDIADIAENTRRGRRPRKLLRHHTVASVIENLIENHRADFETEAMQIRGRRKSN